jgi:hypothetical protein
MFTDVVLTRRVVARFIQASALVIVTDTGTNLVVAGPYDKMKDLLTYLKGQKFRYSPNDKTWWAPKDTLTPQKLKNLQKKINAVNGVSDDIDEPGGKAQARKEAVKGLFEKALSMKLTGLRFIEKGNDLQLNGMLHELEDEIKRAGGNFDGRLSEFMPQKTKPDEFEKLLQAVDHQSDIISKNTSALSGKLPRKFPRLKIEMKFSAKGGNVFIEGKTFDYKDTIKEMVRNVYFLSTDKIWAVAMHEVIPSDVVALITFFEEKESEIADKERGAPQKQDKRPNRKPGYCYTCGGEVEPGDGYLVDVYDEKMNDYDGGFVTKVKHSDPKVCEAAKEAKKIRTQKAKTQADARQNLEKLCEKSEHYVSGKGHKPQGETIDISDSRLQISGGGVWVVIEPGEKNFWYVRNNGSDGADWSLNNVSTGGAGAIGYRLPYTEEAKILIDVAQE